MKKVIITNGSGGCGKDAFAQIVQNYVSVLKISSIDSIKEIVKPYVSAPDRVMKPERYRKLLSDVKRAFVEYNDMPYMTMMKAVNNLLESDDDATALLIIDIREPEEINKIVQEIDRVFGRDKIVTVLITNDNIKRIESNESDRKVTDYIYDYYIYNNDTLEAFEETIRTFLHDLKIL